MYKEIFNKDKHKSRRKELRTNTTQAEKIVWSYLRNRQIDNLKFRRQQGIGEYIVDFYCPKLQFVIEIDGDSHFSDSEQTYDKIRTKYFESLGIMVIRFTNLDVYHSIDGVIDKITTTADSLRDDNPL